MVELYDPDVVFETLLLGTHHGNEAIRMIYAENQKTMAGYDVVPVELIDAGDKVVAVAHAVGAGSTEPDLPWTTRSPSSSHSRASG